MNQDNLLKLRAALEALPPERFDYREPFDKRCGCVLLVMETMFPAANYCEAFGIDHHDLDYLIGCASTRDVTAKQFTDMTDAEATGAAGIAEAIRRIDVLLGTRGAGE